jgi:tetratricopeptide (TPR) repeat protein
MVERDELGGFKMVFKPNQVIILPELAAHVGLASPEFRVDRIIKGGMGDCIRIVQRERSFALKVIQRELVEDPEAWNRYLRELRLWTTLSACDGVVEAFCILRLNELPVVCSRWMDGGNLRPHLRSRSPNSFFTVMSRIVGTLRWAHEKHAIIHRDLKPDNILLDEAGVAFVSDWGLARPLTLPNSEAASREVAGGSTNPVLTAAGSFLGTVYYASPEQLLGEAALDQRTDIYSLGCLMYEWEAGNCPFTGATAKEVCLKHLFERPAPLVSFPKKTVFGAEDVIGACLEKDPTKRLPDYASLDLALTEAAKRRGVLYQAFQPSLRYGMPMVGAGEYGRLMRAGGMGIRNQAGTYGVAEHSEIEQYLREAQALTTVGDYGKAAEIYGSLFVPEAVSAVPDYPHNQHVAINYANCLIALGRAAEAIETLDCLAGARSKPAAYFVNLSLAQIHQSDHRAAASSASEGLLIYAGDQDLIGNLLAAQTGRGAFAEATETAKIRLAHQRDVHSLHEVSALHCKYADTIRELDWPLAVRNLRYAVGLIREAKDLNPQYLPARIQLPIALEAMTAYAQCTDEIVAAEDLPLHVSDRVFLAYLFARCLDRVNDHRGCWEFCDDWLKRIAEVQVTNPVPRHRSVRIERVRAATIADGFCIGKMKDGQRVIAPIASEFFSHIVRDEGLREAGDFCYLARLHEWMEEYEEAYAVLTEARLLYPGYWEIPFQRAVFRLRAGHEQEALRPAQRAAELAPWKTQAWKLLATILGRLGEVTQAADASRRAEEVQRVRDQLAEE